MDLDGPGEVADVDKKGDVGAVAEVKVLVGEALLELLDVAPGDDGDLLPGLRAGCRAHKEKRGVNDRHGRALPKLWDALAPTRAHFRLFCHLY